MSDLYMSYKTLEANEIHFKTCTKCGKTLPATTEYFHKQKKGKYGFKSECKKCAAEYSKQWRKNHKDELSEYKKQYRESNREKVRKQQKQWSENHKERRSEYIKQWTESNREKLVEYKKQWREDNKDKIKQWREVSKDKRREYCKQYNATPQGQAVRFNSYCKRRSKEQNQGTGINKMQWLEMMKYFDWKCAYSGEYIGGKENQNIRSIDHIKPLNRGGDHEIWNLVPMERSLNCSKRDKDLLEWYQEQDFYSEERLQKIYEWQEYAYNKYSKK